LSPPPYSSLSDFEELWNPDLSHRASGETVPSTSTAAAEHADSSRKGKKKRRGDEEEVEDRAELPRMIGMCHKPLNCLPSDLTIHSTVKRT
jgi:hypothetical protein